MMVDFPRWEEGDPIGWLSRAERYFRYHRTSEAFMVDIATIHLEGDRLNQDARRTRTTPRPTAYKPPAPFAPNCPSLPKKLTRKELHDRSTKGLCWHCDEPWSRNHRCKRGHLLLIEPLDDLEEEVHEHEEVTEEEPQSADCMMHALADYVNP
ncbi:hypothetical protein B296_00054776 [Ensete ventricosum]|uniref:Retrotransposon gag domain-containing protein n=1 Tax=Ensete ventricosum TaxID=4639 RepID=A0A426Y2G4_ENSVE|nr:hypothetical protein B296_00054776 [Ensete ventricosum]